MSEEPEGALADAVRRDACKALSDEWLDAAIGRLVEASRQSIRAVVFFGSRMSGAGANTHSAHDLFIVVDEYRSFYEAIEAAGLCRRGVSFLTALNRVLPPNQLSLRLTGGSVPPFHGKCAVISLRHFLRETSRRRRDHFCQGRLFQPVSLVHAATDDTRDEILRALVDVRRQTVRWSGPYLPAEFDVEQYCLRLLEVSLAGEVRPESSARARRLAEAQRERQRPVYAALLGLLEAEGALRRTGDGRWALARRPSTLARLRCRLYFAQSLVRATIRWGKHILTFEGWLDYLVRKVERHSGQHIELTNRERRYPLVFLWPRFFRHMWTKNERGR